MRSALRTTMNKLSLSRTPGKVLPETVSAGGAEYPIRADFRTVLKIFRLLDDPEIADRHKGAMLLNLFYPGDKPEHGMDLFFEFIRIEARQSDPEAAKIDYEYDADAIYASFLQQYRVDLLDSATRLHWYAFCALLDGLGEGTPLRERLYLRKIDTRKLKGKAKRSAEIAKKNAQPPVRTSRKEKALHDALTDALMKGEDPSRLLGNE